MKKQLTKDVLALSPQTITRIRPSMRIPALLLAAGIALLVSNALVAPTVLNDGLRSALVLFGGVFTVTGTLVFAFRLTDAERVPGYAPTGERLRYDELHYPRSARHTVSDAVADGDLDALINRITPGDVSAVAVGMMRTSDDRFVAMRAFEYIDLENRPITDLKVIERHS